MKHCHRSAAPIGLLMLHFMQLLPPTLPSLCPHSHASCLPQLAVMLPLVLHPLSLLSCHRLLSSAAFPCPPLATWLPLVLPLFFSGAVASCLTWMVVVSPLVTLLPSIHLCLCLSLHRHLSLCPSHAICPAGCVAYQHILVHKRNKKRCYHEFFGSLVDELINNTQGKKGIHMMTTAVEIQARRPWRQQSPLH
jgi:hypothetical protein